jgi:hypothetical protein
VQPGMTPEMGAASTAADPSQPGRTCPTHYRYSPSVLARDADLRAGTLYVIGGLYGNPYALEHILALAHAEPQRAVLVFNGDFHWFDVDPCDFAAINWVVMRHTALRGNVETEIASDDEDAGCGCAYPGEVAQDEVERSNAIIARLRRTARNFRTLRKQLGALPMHVVAEVGGVRVAIVHGDAESLAGWAYSEQELSHAHGVQRLLGHLNTSRVQVITSTHTCLPVALTVQTQEGSCALFNNGAAGMPNFRSTRYGVLTRIATRPHPRALYTARIGAVYVEALAVHYDHTRWTQAFLASWPEGSAAHSSYYKRIMEGPAYDLATAVRGAVGFRVDGRSTPVARGTTR